MLDKLLLLMEKQRRLNLLFHLDLQHTSKHKDYLDKYAVVGCYWPPSIVTLEADTLDPLKIIATGSYTYDTNEYLREARVVAIIASDDKPEGIVNIKETGQVW